MDAKIVTNICNFFDECKDCPFRVMRSSDTLTTLELCPLCFRSC